MWKTQPDAAFCIEGADVTVAVCNTELRFGIFLVPDVHLLR